MPATLTARPYVDLRAEFLDSWIGRRPERFDLAREIRYVLDQDPGRDPMMRQVAVVVLSGAGDHS